ncbi:hypothetical protein NMG60_11006813 [Bertholletia excelsa]
MEASYKFLLALIIGSLIAAKKVLAAQHVVGGSQGWEESGDYSSWASGQTFKVGDQLVFKYTPGLHSVVELSDESAYKSCDVSSAANTLSTGNDVVKLSNPGTRYFACGTSGHCGAGMKVKITTVAADSSSTPASSSSAPSSTFAAPSSLSLAHAVLVVFLGAISLFLAF